MAALAYKVVRNFEQAMGEFTGAPYAIAVDSCTAALFLCCKYVKVNEMDEITIPKITYPSVANSIIHAGGRVKFDDIDWQKFGSYHLNPTNIVDSAKRICRNMYIKNHFICLSFHAKKCLKIGRGGMILTDNKEACEWFKLARFDGRSECSLSEDMLTFPGWNMYLSCEQAARGLELFQFLPDENIDKPDLYQDLSKYSFYTKANR